MCSASWGGSCASIQNVGTKLRSETNDFAAFGSKVQTCANVITLKVREVREDLRFAYARCEHFQYVGHANAHAANARTTAALLRVIRDAVEEVI
jgi:hypothetical protein